ncbi:MAG: hypothetical protein QF752_00955 [Planctomycetota bacterium]|jgi:hypothetical protein|nr:hypothetical protein [Planctomycetota bacterium]
MSYETFVSLLNLQSSMRRSLHFGVGQEKRLRRRAIDSITRRLRELPTYEDYLGRMIEGSQLIG